MRNQPARRTRAGPRFSPAAVVGLRDLSVGHSNDINFNIDNWYISW